MAEEGLGGGDADAELIASGASAARVEGPRGGSDEAAGPKGDGSDEVTAPTKERREHGVTTRPAANLVEGGSEDEATKPTIPTAPTAAHGLATSDGAESRGADRDLPRDEGSCSAEGGLGAEVTESTRGEPDNGLTRASRSSGKGSVDAATVSTASRSENGVTKGSKGSHKGYDSYRSQPLDFDSQVLSLLEEFQIKELHSRLMTICRDQGAEVIEDLLEIEGEKVTEMEKSMSNVARKRWRKLQESLKPSGSMHSK